MRWTREKVAYAVGGSLGLGLLGWWVFGPSGGTPGIDAEAPPLGVQATAGVVSAAGGVTRWSDGSRSTEHPDGSVQVVRADGTQVVQRTDGVVQTTRPDGTVTTARTPVPNVPLPHPDGAGGTATRAKEPGVVPFDRVTSGESFDRCLAAGRAFAWTQQPPGCRSTGYRGLPAGRDPRTLMVTARETVRDLQRRLLEAGFYLVGEVTDEERRSVVDGRIGAQTVAAVLAYQLRFNQVMGFGPPAYQPDGTARQSRTPYLRTDGRLDAFTGMAIQSYLTLE